MKKIVSVFSVIVLCIATVFITGCSVFEDKYEGTWVGVAEVPTGFGKKDVINVYDIAKNGDNYMVTIKAVSVSGDFDGPSMRARDPYGNTVSPEEYYKDKEFTVQLIVEERDPFNAFVKDGVLYFQPKTWMGMVDLPTVYDEKNKTLSIDIMPNMKGCLLVKDDGKTLEEMRKQMIDKYADIMKKKYPTAKVTVLNEDKVVKK